jgi:hypothetical protein
MEPFGDTELSDADIEVRKHATCGGRHCLQDESWTWDLYDERHSAADRGWLASDNLTDTNDSIFEPLIESRQR